MPDKRPSATPTVQIENDNTLVTGELRLETPDGERLAELVTGQAYARKAGVEHNVINNNDFEFIFIEIERK